MLRTIVFSFSMAAAMGLSTMPTSSRDLNESSRGGGRSVEFFDQINKASIIMLDEGGLMPHPMAVMIASGIEQVIAKEHDSGAQRSADYLDYEPKLIAVVGQDASRLHIGRSRQDMGATIARMSLRDGLIKVCFKANYESGGARRPRLSTRPDKRIWSLI
jgi:argininosuccinate lyase